MNDIITEINQELREERGRALWNKYGIYVIAAVIAIVIVVAGRQAYVSYEQNARNNAANAYMAALEQEGTSALDAIAGQGGEGYPMLARFSTAARLAEAGDAGAEAAYMAIANDASLDGIYRNAGMIMAVMNAGSETSVDEKITRIASIANAPGPWQNLALEMMIGLALEKGDEAAARKHFETLRFSSNVSADLNQRLSLIDAALGKE